MKSHLITLILITLMHYNHLKAQVFLGPYMGFGANYINGLSNLSPLDNSNVEIYSLGTNLEVALTHPLYFKSFIQYSVGYNAYVLNGNQNTNVEFDNALETAVMISYRYMNASIEFGPGYNFQTIILRDFDGTEMSYLKGKANLITANAQASVYFKYGFSTHLRLSHRVNNISWYSDNEIERYINKYLLVEFKVAYNIPLRKLKIQPKVRPFKPKDKSAICPPISPLSK